MHKILSCYGHCVLQENTITQLKDDTGIMVADHAGKAAILLLAFKNRMGISL
jgi:hypothetical protein